MKKHIIVFGIIFLFLSSVIPMTTGIDTDSEVDVELSRMLDNLKFMCMGPDGLIVEKYEYYKEQILNMYSSEEDVVDSDNKESITTVEQPSIPKLSSGGPMDSAWSMLCHDLHHTGQSPYSTEDNPYLEKWRYYNEGWVMDSPVIDNNGTIYYGGYCGEGRDGLIALNPNGTFKWKFKTDGLVLGSSPAIGEDGTIYFGSWDTKLYAINPDGTRKWKTAGLGGNVASSPAIAEDGTIYVGTMSTGNFIVAVNPNGTIKWRYKTDYHVVSDPAIDDDGTIYCGSGDTKLYALYPNGTLKWKFKTGDDIKGPPSIADDGIVYIGSWDDYLYAIYPNNGTMKWKCKIGDGTETNPSIASDGTIYVGSYDGHLYAVYSNGTVKWSFSVKGNIHQSSPAISADGTIYFGTDDNGHIYAVNPNGTERWSKKLSKGDYWVESSPAIGEDGTVYIGSAVTIAKGYLHAFGNVESNSPPNTPSIYGSTSIKVGEEYRLTYVGSDPDNNPVQLFLDWGDGTSGWVDWYASGEKGYRYHTWKKQGTYTISAKVRDSLGEESDWDYLEVIVPRDKSTDNMYWRLVERFPLIDRLLNLGWWNLE